MPLRYRPAHLSLLVCLLVAVPRLAHADGNFVGGAFGLAVPGRFAASGEFSRNTLGCMEVYGRFSYLYWAGTSKLSSDSLEVYAPMHSDARPRVQLFAATAGIRCTGPVPTRVKPYVLAGAGWSYAIFSLRSSLDVDYADLVLARTSSEWDFNDPFVELGAGVTVPYDSTTLNIGCRYGHPVSPDAPHIFQVEVSLSVRLGR